VALLGMAAAGCSIKGYAINMVGNALSSGDSVYETDDDIELVGAALPFGLKLTESLLSQSPNHSGLLLTACRGFVLYAYAYVSYPAEISADTDLDVAAAGRDRARRLYQRAFGHCVRGLERWYPGFGNQLLTDAAAAAGRIESRHADRDLPWLYWTSASLGLAVSASPGDAAMLARLPAVQALLDRALTLDETWDEGALHEFAITLASAGTGDPDLDAIRHHYERAVELSGGTSASAHLAYAEIAAVRRQDAVEFRRLIAAALAVDPDATPSKRLVNLLAHRRAHWLAGRIDDLIVDDASAFSPDGGRP
jgi:hypothetical protein